MLCTILKCQDVQHTRGVECEGVWGRLYRLEVNSNKKQVSLEYLAELLSENAVLTSAGSSAHHCGVPKHHDFMSDQLAEGVWSATLPRNVSSVRQSRHKSTL